MSDFEQLKLDNIVFGPTLGPDVLSDSSEPELNQADNTGEIMVPLSRVMDWIEDQAQAVDDDTSELIRVSPDVFTDDTEMIEKAARAGELLGRKHFIEKARGDVARLAEPTEEIQGATFS